MISGAKLNGKKFPNYNPMFQKKYIPRETYTLLYYLTNLKNKLGLEESIEELCQIKYLELGDNQIKKILQKDLVNFTSYKRNI